MPKNLLARRINYAKNFSNITLSNRIVYSHYKNPKYWHGSSARGSLGLDRSEWVPKDVMSYASIQTVWLDGNHAYWRVDENKQ